MEGERRINVHEDDEAAFRWACWKGNMDVIRLLLSLTGDRRIDVRVRNDAAFRCACTNRHAKAAELILTSGADRLPSRAVFEAAVPNLRTRFQPYDYWVRRWENRPRAARMVEWRATLEAQIGLRRVPDCCKFERPLELKRSLVVLGAARCLTKGDLLRLEKEALSHGSRDCAKVLASAALAKAKNVRVTHGDFV